MSDNVNNQKDFFQLVNLDADGNIGVVMSGGTGGATLWEAGGGTESIKQINTLSPNSANADYSVITGSNNQTYDGATDSFIGGGNNNVISGGTAVNSTIIGGFNNSVVGPNSSIISSSINSITSFGTNNNIFGGTENTIEGPSTQNNMFGADSCKISGPAAFNNIFGAINAEIDGPISFSRIFGGVNPKIKTLGSGNYIIGGDNSEIDFGTGCYTIGGANNEIVGNTAGSPGSTSSTIFGGYQNKVIGNDSIIIYGRENTIIRGSLASSGKRHTIFGGSGNTINIDSNTDSIIIGGLSNTINNTVSNSTILGGNGITATQNDTVYVPNLVINTSITPTSTSDAAGEEGNVSYDATYMYVKTSTGWGRVALDYSF